MAATNEEVARAISGHDFETARPALGEDVVWTLVGEAPIEGRDAVVALLEATAAELANTASIFRNLRSFVAGDTVIVETEVEYTAEGGLRTVVASCDIYEFRDGLLDEIRSYNIEVAD
ncbi:MAG TPA: nuclear transport factor 2 family protein [Naasia sp.]|jgi:limonene-1,2-epoxide hydrolase